MRKPQCLAMVATPGALLAGQGDTVMQTLAPYEIEKALGIKSTPARDSYMAAHLLVRMTAARFTGQRDQDLVLHQHCAQCGGPHGRPAIAGHPNLHVSLSHTDTAVAAVAGPLPNAIDVEGWDKLRLSDLLAGNVFSAGELRLLKRAAMKGNADLHALRL